MNARDRNGRFQTGNIGGPGRPPGSRNALSEQFLAAICQDWTQHGMSVLAKVRECSPASYLRVIASLVPREMSLELHNEFSHLSDAELDARLWDDFVALAAGREMPDAVKRKLDKMKKAK
jgi:hypothetical protein